MLSHEVGYWLQQFLNACTLASFYVPLAVAFALVQGSDTDAQAIADESIAFDPSDDMRVALVRAALSAKQARSMHLVILDACKTPNPLTRTQVAAALTNPVPPQTPASTPAP